MLYGKQKFYISGFFGIVCEYLCRINLSMAIVPMLGNHKIKIEYICVKLQRRLEILKKKGFIAGTSYTHIL